MLVSYPMYSISQTQSNQNLWWQSVRNNLSDMGVSTPQTMLSTDNDLVKHWLHPELLFSQTCGFPLVSLLKSKVKLIGTPVYAAHGCDDAAYCSFFIVRKDDARNELEEYANSKFAYNGQDSQSGFNAVRVNLLERDLSIPFFADNIESGGHRNSIRLVSKNKADICAVDCVSHALLKSHEVDVLQNTRVLCATKNTPGLPFITSLRTPDSIIDKIKLAIRQTCQDPALGEVNSTMLITDITDIPLETYYANIDLSHSHLNVL